MKVLNFGSLNYDTVYSVDHILLPGETIAASRMEIFCGGKGLNQSIALARAGAQVNHAGMVGEDGEMLLNVCRENGVDISHIQAVPGKSGHTVIQVDRRGQNSILLYGGANRALTPEFCREVFKGFGSGDLLLLQNEVNGIDGMMELACEKGMRVALNPSPYDAAIDACDLNKVSYLLLNEIEGWQISGEKEPEKILDFFASRYPQTAVVLTLGRAGAVYQSGGQRLNHGIYSVKVEDTTAAGDTFTGFFLAGVLKGEDAARSLELASKASSLAVTRKGAVPSIPTLKEVLIYPFSKD